MAIFAFRSAEQVLNRLGALEQRLERLERALEALRGAEVLRAELRAKDERLDALAEQALHLAEHLTEARAEIARLKGSA